MTHETTRRRCYLHLWQRTLEQHGELDCVVRVCRRCGRKELCWSRRPICLSAAAPAGGDPPGMPHGHLPLIG